MYIPDKLLTVLVFVILLLSISNISKAQLIVEIIDEEATVRSSRSSNPDYTLGAEVGDVFGSRTYDGDWVVLQTFSGMDWYIERYDVEFINPPSLPSLSPSTRAILCEEVATARMEASEQATEEYPDDSEQQTIYRNVLYDQSVLEIFRKYDVEASEYLLLTRCSQPRLTPLQ